jgi:hypothetical protein
VLHHELHRSLQAGHQRAAAAADQQSNRVLVEWLEEERPAAACMSGGQLCIGVLDVAEDQGALRLEQRHGVARCVAGHPDHAVADPQGRLERRQDPVGAVHVTADQVLQPVVAVQASASLPKLNQPGPDLGGGRLDGDRVCPHEAGPVDELVAGPGGLMFLVGGAPLVDPRPDHDDIDPTHEQDQDARGQKDRSCHDRLALSTTTPRLRATPSVLPGRRSL